MSKVELETRLMFIPKYFNLKTKYNNLLNDYEMLLQNQKDEIYNKILDAVAADDKLDRVVKENKKLRAELKEYKDIFKSNENLGKEKLQKKTRTKSKKK